MGSKTFGGVRFQVFPNDHHPRHIHADVAGVEVIIDLLDNQRVALAIRRNAVSRRAKISDVKRALKLASENYEALITLWEKHHG